MFLLDILKLKPKDGDQLVFSKGHWVSSKPVPPTPEVPTEISTLTILVGSGITGFSKVNNSAGFINVLTGGERSLTIKHNKKDIPILVTVYREQNNYKVPILNANYSCNTTEVHFDDYVQLVGSMPSTIIITFRGLK